MVCAGIVERCGDRIYNAAVLIAPDGAVLLHHRKLHEIDFARRLYTRGDRLGVAETAFGRIGLMICADAFADGLVVSRALGQMGALLILSPCAWAVPPNHDQVRDPYGKLWRDSYGPPAREYKMTIAGCSNVGPVTAGEWAGWRCIGCSMVVGADGEPVAQAAYGTNAEELLAVHVPVAA
jgi:predicted amidohydrolase